MYQSVKIEDHKNDWRWITKKFKKPVVLRDVLDEATIKRIEKGISFALIKDGSVISLDKELTQGIVVGISTTPDLSMFTIEELKNFE